MKRILAWIAMGLFFFVLAASILLFFGAIIYSLWTGDYEIPIMVITILSLAGFCAWGANYLSEEKKEQEKEKIK